MLDEDEESSLLDDELPTATAIPATAAVAAAAPAIANVENPAEVKSTPARRVK